MDACGLLERGFKGAAGIFEGTLIDAKDLL